MKVAIIFSECEHTGDMDMYYGDIQDAGGKPDWNSIVIDHDAEMGSIEVEIDDMEAFVTNFMKTDSHGFATFGSIVS